jgi:formate C-acetyltransferase
MPETQSEIHGEDSAWSGFDGQAWRDGIDVAEFIRANVNPYAGDAGFLEGATDRTHALWSRITPLLDREREKCVLDVSQHPSDICAHPPGYIDRDLELIVGLQTDAPLKRAIFPDGGIKMVDAALEAFGYTPDPEVTRTFTDHRKTHNQGVFDAYTTEIRMARKSGIITGLPDAYGRGRIIGDYRRVALYGVDALIAAKSAPSRARAESVRRGHDPRARRVDADQIRALEDLKAHGRRLRFRPAAPGRERARSDPVDLPGLPGGYQTAERCGHVGRSRLDLLRYLPEPRYGSRA